MALTVRYMSQAGAGIKDGLSEATAWGLADHNANVVPGMLVHMKGTVAAPLTTNMTYAIDGTDTDPIHYMGYSVSPGDGSRCYCTGYQYFNGDVNTTENWEVAIPPAQTVDAVRIGGAKQTLKNVKAGAPGQNVSWGSMIAVMAGAGGTTLIDCEMESVAPTQSSSVFRIEGAGASANLIGCRLKVSGGAAPANGCIYIASGAVEVNIVDCVVIGDGVCDGVSSVPYTANVRFVGNTFYNCDKAISFPNGWGDVTVTNAQLIANNLLHTCAYGVHNAYTPGTTGLAFLNNSFFAVTSARYSSIHEAYQINDVVCSVDPCVDAAAGNFDLNNKVGGGADVRANALEAPVLL